MTTETPTTTKAEMTEDTFTQHGSLCQRVMFRTLNPKGREIGFAWAEQHWNNQEVWTAYRWSEQVGARVLRCLLPREEAIEVARKHAESLAQ